MVALGPNYMAHRRGPLSQTWPPSEISTRKSLRNDEKLDATGYNIDYKFNFRNASCRPGTLKRKMDFPLLRREETLFWEGP